MGLDPLRLALDGGEDYELLFTVPKRLARALAAQSGGRPGHSIGEITRGKGIMLIDCRPGTQTASGPRLGSIPQSAR